MIATILTSTTIRRLFHIDPVRLLLVTIMGALVCVFGWAVAGGLPAFRSHPATPPPPPLELFVSEAMDLCAVPPSLSRTLVREAVTRVATKWMGGDRAREEAFVVMVARESCFRPTVRSPKGATGLAQIMPAYAKDFAALCGLGPVKAEDLTDPEVSLTLGACLFSDLLDRKGGSVPKALIAYNAGLWSGAMRAADRGGTVSGEPASYVTGHTIMLKDVHVRLAARAAASAVGGQP